MCVSHLKSLINLQLKSVAIRDGNPIYVSQIYLEYNMLSHPYRT